MPAVTSVDDFLAAPEAAALDAIPEPARRSVAARVIAALRDDLGTPVARLRREDAHDWLLHAVPERFERGDSLARHVAPVISAWLEFAARVVGPGLSEFMDACAEMLPELGDALAHGHRHGHAHGAVQAYVRETPKVGRNDACPCGSGKKFKKCHGP